MSMPDLTLTNTDPVPTTDRLAEECPRFRILIVGRSGTGKSSLINAIFKASLPDVQAGSTSINLGITPLDNKHLIIHDSEGYEPGNEERFRILEKFITERSREEVTAERLHAIWLCITVPLAGNRIFEAGDERIFRLNRNKVPIIVVFTKLDLLVARLYRSGMRRGKISQEVAETYFTDKYGQIFERSTKNIAGQIPYALVATSMPDTLQRLVNVTMRSIRIDAPGPSNGFTCIEERPLRRTENDKQDEDVSDSAQIALATAQRIDMAGKIIASVKVGKKKYWRAIASGISFLGISLRKCLYAIHKDIIKIWNIRGSDEYLLSDAFCSRMVVVVDDLSYRNTKNAHATQNKITIASAAAAAGMVNMWSNGDYKTLPQHIRCLMGYVVDLTLILQAIFQVSLQDQVGGKVAGDCVDEIVYEFHCSDKKKRIHNTIWSFVRTQHPFAKESVVEKIESLIRDNEMTTKNDTQFDHRRPPLPSLLNVLRFELMATGPLVNPTILGLTGKLLVLPDFRNIVSETNGLDIELLLDFILYLLHNNSLSTTDIPDANRKAKRLMFKLISDRDILPKSLFIDGVKTEDDFTSRPIGMGGFGNVYKGEYGKQKVALKVLYTGQKKDSLYKEFCREALAWRSLSHRFIIPLLGIFEEKSHLFLVSPFMSNGTLTKWRESSPSPVPAEIHRLMQEVAAGVQYIHSEGIVHGDLRGENILLDPDLHCQITDFALTRHSDTTATASNSRTLNFAAPELLGVREECGQHDCDGYPEERDTFGGKKSVPTDVYAFGCLYYAIYFNTAPFEGKNEVQIIFSVTKGARPERLDNPVMDNDIWQLIQLCWKHNASERPTMQKISETMAPFVPVKHPSFLATSPSSPTALSSVFPLLLASLNESTTRGSSTVNTVTLDLASKLLDLPEYTIAASELSTADIELLLNFLLHLLRESGALSLLGVQDANRKARRLMFKLTSMANAIPKFLYITDVEIEADLDVISTGGFGRVYTAKYKGKQVALKVMDKSRHDASLRKDFLREAIAWRSLSHRFILPFLGIYEDKSQLFLVSPFMENGTLTQWRRKREPGVIEINRTMLEVAEGILYLHSEGIVHGDLHGGNVLLDSNFHCQITDFGLTRHAEITVQSTSALSVHFAAPELFGMCTKCSMPDCGGCHEGDREEYRSKTKATDIFAFGCLYYTIFFSTIPFDGYNNLQVLQFVTQGKRPKRFENPRMADNVWDVIQSCMETNPSQRPKVEDIVMRVTSFVQAGS